MSGSKVLIATIFILVYSAGVFFSDHCMANNGKDAALRLGPDVTSLILVNADTDQDIVEINNGDVFYLEDIGTSNLNVRAEVGPNTESVVFGYQGASPYRLENLPVYAIGGNSGGDYYNWEPEKGNNVITATAYTGDGGTELAGEAFTVSFEILEGKDVLPAVVRINSGGPTISYGDSIFVADDFFAGNGDTYRKNSIADIFNSEQDEIYKTERNTKASRQSFSYNIPVTNGDYSINLHFAEIYWGATAGGPGGTQKRIFDVTLEGETILTNVDLNAEVDPMTAVIKSFTTTVTDQSLDLTFSASVDQPKVSAIEVFGEGSLISEPDEVIIETLNIVNCPTEPIYVGDIIDLDLEFFPANTTNQTVAFTASDGVSVDYLSGEFTATSPGEVTVTVTNFSEGSVSDQCTFTVLDKEPEEGGNDLPAVVRINSGGPTVSYGDTIFVADEFFEGDGSRYTNSDIGDIFGTSKDEIYKSERSTKASRQSFSYHIPVTNGDYSINLHFAEIYWGATSGGAGGTQKRIFDVTLEGEAILTDLDLNAEADPMTAVIKSFTTTVTDESLDLVFSASVNQPKVSAIEVYGTGGLINDPTSCTWDVRSSSALSKLESQSVKVNGKLYVLAGFLEGLKITGATEIYDPETDTWTFGASMPVPVTHMGAVAVGEEIWILAGFAGDNPGVATNLVQIYNTTTNTWSTGPSLPNRRGSGAAVYSEGKIHYFGGLLPDRVTDVGDHYVLDVDDQASGWKTLAPMPEPRNHLGGAAVNGIIYAIGGQFGHDDGVEDQSFLHAYDPATNTWSERKNLRSDRSHFEPGTIVHNDKIIIVGGRDGGFFYDDVTEYNPATDTWQELCQLPLSLLAPSAKVFGDQLVVANGGDNGICCLLDQTISIGIEPELPNARLSVEEASGFSVLVYHETDGHRHESIHAGIEMIKQFGTDNNWIVNESANSSVFTDASLGSVDVVVWMNTSGNGLLTENEQKAFERFVQNGGGTVGFHAATDTYRDGSWPWYNELMGAIAQTDSIHAANNFDAKIDVVGSHPAVKHLTTEWSKNEEFYFWGQNGANLFDGNINLLEVRSKEIKSYDSPRPITWYKEFDGGRSFYTALGHNRSDYIKDEKFRRLAKQAILWAGGRSGFTPENTAIGGEAASREPSGELFESTLTIYPNPVIDILTVKTLSGYPLQLLLVSPTGTILAERNDILQSTIDMSGLKAGMYVLIVDDGEAQRRFKLIKK